MPRIRASRGEGDQVRDPGHLQTVELMLDPSSQDPTWRPIISINLAYTYAATYVQMLECYNSPGHAGLSGRGEVV